MTVRLLPGSCPAQARPRLRGPIESLDRRIKLLGLFHELTATPPRPHNEPADLKLTIFHVAKEKQAIVNLVAAKLGLAIVPRWTSRFAVSGVRFMPLALENAIDLILLPAARVAD